MVAGAAGYTCLMFVWFSLPAYLPRILADLDLSATQGVSSPARSR